MKLILGSASPTRQKLLSSWGYTFDVLTADLDERAIRNDDPHTLPLKIADAKMDAILPRIVEPAVVITVDLFMLVDGIVREKPLTKEEAYTFIQSFSSTPQTSVCGVVLFNTAMKERITFLDETIVTCDPIPEASIQTFVESGEALEVAGALKADHPLFKPFVHVEGEWESLLGLPKEKTIAVLNKWGV